VFFLIGALLGVCLVGWVVYSLATLPLGVEIAEPGGPQVPGVPDSAMEKAIAEGASQSLLDEDFEIV
jgi:hypothetical protein